MSRKQAGRPAHPRSEVKLSTLSLEYVKVQVTFTVAGVATDPTADTVSMAFPARHVAPVTGDWKTASWESSGSTYFARCLVGTGGTLTLGVGVYDVWVKVTDSPEIPVVKAPGILEMTA